MTDVTHVLRALGRVAATRVEVTIVSREDVEPDAAS